MSIRPLWQCRKFENIYQISAIVREGESVYRSCESISQQQLDHAWFPEVLILDAIRITSNSLYDMIDANRSPENLS